MWLLKSVFRLGFYDLFVPTFFNLYFHGGKRNMQLVSAVGSSWEKEKKKKDICSAGCNYILAWSIFVRIFLGAILHFAFLLFSLLACLSVPRGKTGERRRTHVPQVLIISWPGASWNAFCFFAFLHF